MSTKTIEAVPATAYSHGLFQLGELEAVHASRPISRQLEIEPGIAAAFGLHTLDGSIPAESKTMGFQGKLFVNGRPDPVAILDDLTVTVTRMGNPQTGLPFLLMSLNYFITSHGFRTAETYDEGLLPSSTVYFRNASGGLMWWWNIGFLTLKCGWNHESQVFAKSENVSVGWFDLWAGVQHEVKGNLFAC